MVGTDSVCLKCATFLVAKYDFILDANTIPSKLQSLWHLIL